MAIALFFAAETAGGLAAPTILGALLQTGDRHKVFSGHLLGGTLIALASVAAIVLGVDTERQSLKQIAEAPQARARP